MPNWALPKVLVRYTCPTEFQPPFDFRFCHKIIHVNQRCSAQDAGPLSIRVNVVCPSWVRTAMWEEECKKTTGIDQFVAAAVPVGRPAEPEEVASAVGFLCSPGASYISGTSMIIDAGLTLTVHL